MRALNGRPHAVLISPRRATASQARQTSCISRGLAQQGWPPPPSAGTSGSSTRESAWPGEAGQEALLCSCCTIPKGLPWGDNCPGGKPCTSARLCVAISAAAFLGRGELLQLLLLATWSRRSPLRHFWPQSHLAFLMEAAAGEGRKKKWGGG